MTNQKKPSPYMRASEILELIPVSRSLLFSGAIGCFPKPVHISPKRVVWVRQEVEEFLAKKLAERFLSTPMDPNQPASKE